MTSWAGRRRAVRSRGGASAGRQVSAAWFVVGADGYGADGLVVIRHAEGRPERPDGRGHRRSRGRPGQRPEALKLRPGEHQEGLALREPGGWAPGRVTQDPVQAFRRDRLVAA